MMKYRLMTPSGLYCGELEARDDEQARSQAKAPPYCEEVLDIIDGKDEYNKPILILVVPDE